jgi:hypothetical protein
LYLLLVSGCGFSVGGSATTDAPGVTDGGPDGPPVTDDDATVELDASLCYGTGFGRTCLTAAPTAARILADGTFNTDGPGCTQVTNDLCIVTATDLSIANGTTVRAIGSRPLVLVATGTLNINGTIGASSLATQPAGAGSSTSPCATPAAATNDTGGAAGAAGGSFGGAGGSGGTGDINETGLPAGPAAGQGAAVAMVPTTIRAGCTGGSGGVGVGLGGAGGRGGGAIYFIGGTSIMLASTARVFAVGEGGRGANNLGGGGGGGSGGLLGFDAPMISFSGLVIANGGGGGEGAGVGTFTNGDAGGDGTATGARAPGGVSGTNGGNGGDSSGGGSLDGIGGEAVNEGGGGGGGGAGVIYIKGTFIAGGATISPVPSVTP